MLKWFAWFLAHGEGGMPRAIIIVVCRLGKTALDASNGLQPGLTNKAIKLNIVHFSKNAAQILVFQSEPETSITILTLLGSQLADTCPLRQILISNINCNPHLSSTCFGPEFYVNYLEESSKEPCDEKTIIIPFDR